MTSLHAIVACGMQSRTHFCMQSQAAVKTIQTERTDLQSVLTVPADGMVTMDFREDRVRVFVDGEGKVAREPSCG